MNGTEIAFFNDMKLISSIADFTHQWYCSIVAGSLSWPSFTILWKYIRYTEVWLLENLSTLFIYTCSLRIADVIFIIIWSTMIVRPWTVLVGKIDHFSLTAMLCSRSYHSLHDAASCARGVPWWRLCRGETCHVIYVLSFLSQNTLLLPEVHTITGWTQDALSKCTKTVKSLNQLYMIFCILTAAIYAPLHCLLF